MSLYDSAIKYAMKILNHEPNYSLDRLREISETAYVIAKRYIDDINSSKKNVQAVINTGLIRNLTVSFIMVHQKGLDIIMNATKNMNVKQFLSGVNLINESEDLLCSKLAPYIPGLTRLNLEVNRLELKIRTIEKTNKPTWYKLLKEVVDLKSQRISLIIKLLERMNIE